jgi:hypothetical protein
MPWGAEATAGMPENVLVAIPEARELAALLAKIVRSEYGDAIGGIVQCPA